MIKLYITFKNKFNNVKKLRRRLVIIKSKIKDIHISNYLYICRGEYTKHQNYLYDIHISNYI